MEETTAEIKPVIPTEIRHEIKKMRPLDDWGEVICIVCVVIGILGILATLIVPLLMEFELAIPTAIEYILVSIFTIIGGYLFKRLMYFFAVLENKALND